MAEWMTRWGTYQATENPTDEDKAQVMGDFWVWDDDGWAYWANAIQPDTATGLLLDGIELTTRPATATITVSTWWGSSSQRMTSAS